MRIGCLLFSHLRAKSEMRRDVRLKDQPALIVDRAGTRSLVVDHTPPAVGVRVGMTLDQATSHHVDSIVLEADEPYYQQVFDDVLQRLTDVCPRVEGPELGIAYARIDGLQALYGGEDRLVCALLEVVPGDLEPSVGVGDAKFPAFVAARTGRAGQATRVPSDAARFLSPHSIDLLPVSPEIKAGLHLLGLHNMGDVSQLPKGLFVDQFGQGGLQAWSLCNGIDERPLIPIKAAETIVERTSFPNQSASLELFLVTVDILLKKAFTQPRMLGRTAAGVTLECTYEETLTWRKTIRFKQGLHRWEQTSAIIRSPLQTDPPRMAIEEIRLALVDLSGASGVQLGLWADPKKIKWRRLQQVEERLRSKLAADHILHRVVEVAPWHPAPEMRSVQIPINRSGNYYIKPIAAPVEVSVRESRHHRPVAVRLSGKWRPVTGVTDLWTFDLWWLPKPITRTYYRLNGEDGRQITLFYDRRGNSWYQQNG